MIGGDTSSAGGASGGGTTLTGSLGDDFGYRHPRMDEERRMGRAAAHGSDQGRQDSPGILDGQDVLWLSTLRHPPGGPVSEPLVPLVGPQPFRFYLLIHRQGCHGELASIHVVFPENLLNVLGG